MSWTALVVLSVGAYAFKLTGVVAGERFADRLAPVTALLPAALFSALVVTMAVADGPFLVVDARLRISTRCCRLPTNMTSGSR